MPAYVEKFISDKIPVIRSSKEIFPIWLYMVRYPRLFFSVIRTSDRLSITNAFAFCLGSATVIAATAATIFSLAAILSPLLGYGAELKTIDITELFLIEMVAFIFILANDAVAACAVYLCSLFVLEVVSIKRVFIASLYVATFLLTIQIALNLVGVGIALLSGSFAQHVIILDQVVYGPPLDRTPIVQLLGGWHTAWVVLMFVWLHYVSPTLAVIAFAQVTGVSYGKLTIGGFVLIIAVVITAVFFKLLARLFF